jgi:arylsulfatase A-like enzyme
MVEKPNIVFVLCDNVGWGGFSCYGGQHANPADRQVRQRGKPLQQLHVVMYAGGEFDHPATIWSRASLSGFSRQASSPGQQNKAREQVRHSTERSGKCAAGSHTPVPQS